MSALKDQITDPTYSIQRIYRDVDLEIFYYNNLADSSQNCDREGPELEPGPMFNGCKKSSPPSYGFRFSSSRTSFRLNIPF